MQMGTFVYVDVVFMLFLIFFIQPNGEIDPPSHR
jgi:hypothetical protein